MAKKSAAKTTSLFPTLQALLTSLQPTATDVGYHSNPKNKRAFSYDFNEDFRVSFEGEDYFVRFNYSKDRETFEALIGYARGREHSGNTPDISFNESHFGPHFLLGIAPSLKRCNDVLAIRPKPIGDFPALVVGTKNRFLIGFPDVELFPRLFRLCFAKKTSIDLLRVKRLAKSVKRMGAAL